MPTQDKDKKRKEALRRRKEALRGRNPIGAALVQSLADVAHFFNAPPVTGLPGPSGGMFGDSSAAATQVPQAQQAPQQVAQVAPATVAQQEVPVGPENFSATDIARYFNITDAELAEEGFPEQVGLGGAAGGTSTGAASQRDQTAIGLKSGELQRFDLRGERSGQPPGAPTSAQSQGAASDSVGLINALQNFSGQVGTAEQALAEATTDPEGFFDKISNAVGLTGPEGPRKFQQLMGNLAIAIAGPHQDAFGPTLARLTGEGIQAEMQAELIGMLDRGVPLNVAVQDPRLSTMTIDSRKAALDSILSEETVEQGGRQTTVLERGATVKEEEVDVQREGLQLSAEALAVRRDLGIRGIAERTIGHYLGYLAVTESAAMRAAGGNINKVPAAKSKIAHSFLGGLYAGILPMNVSQYINSTSGVINADAVLAVLNPVLKPRFLEDVKNIEAALASGNVASLEAAMDTMMEKGRIGNPIDVQSADEAHTMPPGLFIRDAAGEMFLTNGHGFDIIDERFK